MSTQQLVITGGNGQFSQQKLRVDRLGSNMNILGSVLGNDKSDLNPLKGDAN